MMLAVIINAFLVVVAIAYAIFDGFSSGGDLALAILVVAVAVSVFNISWCVYHRRKAGYRV